MVSEMEGLDKRKKTGSNDYSGNKEMDMYKSITTYEEAEAIARSPDQDSEKFLSTCDFIRQAMNNILSLKASKDANAKEEIRETQVKTTLAFLELKKLNRMEKFRTKFARDSLANAKAGVDSRHLQLQNLLYEVMHLKKEVIKCFQFKSKDELIDLVSEEEFYKEAPENISRPDITKDNPHLLRLARLEWELVQRKELAILCDELTENKKKMGLNIESKLNKLDNLAPQLRAILEASRPLQDSLNLPLDNIYKEHQIAALLPSPLYVIYTKSTAYRDAYDSTVLVTVEGDENDVKRLNNSTSNSNSGSANLNSNQDGIQDSDSDQDILIESQSEEIPVHKKRHYRISKEVREEEKKTRLLQKHPLSVQLVLTVKNNVKLTLKFYYLSNLKVITIESNLNINDIGGVTAADILMSESILRELYPNDIGLESPNPANAYQLNRHKLSGTFSSLGLGIPYKWAQRLAGLNFISTDINEQKSNNYNNLGQYNIENILKEIKRRVKARLDLCNDIKILESGQFNNTHIEMINQKIVTRLDKFNSITWQCYSTNPITVDICKHQLVVSTDIFYEAILRNGNHELIALIAIKPDYPKHSPIFNINIKTTISISNDTLKDIEREINVMWEQPPTLLNQLSRLCACFDIFLETESLIRKDKIYFHSVKGKMRAKPYKYLPIGGGIFIQR